MTRDPKARQYVEAMNAVAKSAHRPHVDRSSHDPFYKGIQDTIKAHGHSVVGVGDNPPFSYTIGLYEKHGFELLIIGLNPVRATLILNDMAKSLDAGFEIEEGFIYAENHPANKWVMAPVMFKWATKEILHEKYSVQADRYYDTRIPVMQVVIPDRQMRMPHEKGYDHAYMNPRQPLLYD